MTLRKQAKGYRRCLIVPLSLFLAVASSAFAYPQPTERTLEQLPNGVRVVAIRGAAGWGIAVRNAGRASVEQMLPVAILFSGQDESDAHGTGYSSILTRLHGMRGIAQLIGPDGSRFDIEDTWLASGDLLRLDRRVTIHGSSGKGFASSITLTHPGKFRRTDLEYFAPGMIYGGTAHLTPSAIGGSETYEHGHGAVQIREDRLPAPMFGTHFADGSALTVLDTSPNGSTTSADSHDKAISDLSDERFQFGSIGGRLTEGEAREGFWFPGSEGEVTYRGDTYPGGQEHRWRRRYHPIRDGFVQKYSVAFRFSLRERYPVYTRNAWRWAYSTLAPAAPPQDLIAIERGIVEVLASETVAAADRSGIPNADSSVPSHQKPDLKAIMGFTGKNLEAAELLLAEADRETDVKRAARDRRLGLAIFTSFLRLKVNPPVAEGFSLESGEPALALNDGFVYLRSFGDDMKATLRAYERERHHGRLHADWLSWAKGFADWLLPQQGADGSFPRSWRAGTGEVANRSPQSSYNPIPFLVLLSSATGESKYLDSAERAGNFAWNAGQQDESFVGGTIDNPDILDKEAGTLSLEAYLALYEATHKTKWVERARAAADYAETYIYLWNVPMPIGESDTVLHWKRQASTVGTQLIATGHSLTDEYMAFDVDSYARLSRYSGDPHYMRVARLLLLGTKNMIATPDRPYDLKGSGWQQEHWSFAPPRGFGLHRLWLPWVATSQLKGIVGLREYDSKLFRELAGTEALHR